MNIRIPLTALALMVALPAAAQQTGEYIQAFRSYKEVRPELQTSEVVHVHVDEELERRVFAVYDVQTETLVPHQTIIAARATPLTVDASPPTNAPMRMVDGSIETYASFDLPQTGDGFVRLVMSAAKPITTSALVVVRDNFVAFPKEITVRAVVGGTETLVVRNQKMKSEWVSFPETVAKEWIIDLTYTQPLRISELRFDEKIDTTDHAVGVRFVAQPQHTYRVYANPDRHLKLKHLEVGNLHTVQNVQTFNLALIPNPAFIPADSDEDGLPDALDNCVQYYNPDQTDLDENGRGDACDDTDQDGIINAEDNCPDHANRTQRDEDGDGIGDPCDGSESRFTEQYPWLPWLGMGAAAIVLIVMFMQAVRVARK